MATRSRRKTNMFESTLTSNTAITPSTPPSAREQCDSDDDCFVASAGPPSTTAAIRSQHSMQSDSPFSTARCTRMTMHAHTLDEESLASSPENKLGNRLFHGVVAFIDVIMNSIDYSSTLAHDIVKGGGERAMRLGPTVTHMVFDNGRTANWVTSELCPLLQRVNSACVDAGALRPTTDRVYVAKYVPPVDDLRDFMPSAKRKYIRKVESLNKRRPTPLTTRSTRVNRRILGSVSGHERAPRAQRSPIISPPRAPAGMIASTSRAVPCPPPRRPSATALDSSSSTDASLATVVHRKMGVADGRVRRASSSGSSVTLGQPFTRIVTVGDRRRSTRLAKVVAVNTLDEHMDTLRLVSPPTIVRPPKTTLREKARELFANDSSSSSLASTPLIRRVEDMCVVAPSMTTECSRDSTPRRRSARIAESLLTLSTNRESLNVAQHGRPSKDEFMSTPQLRMYDRVIAARGRRKEIVLANMDTARRALCASIVSKMGVYRVVSRVSVKTEMVVCDEVAMTPCVLEAIVHQCPVVHIRWLQESQTHGEWLDHSEHLVDGMNEVDLCTSLGLPITEDVSTADCHITDTVPEAETDGVVIITSRWLIDTIINGHAMPIADYHATNVHE